MTIKANPRRSGDSEGRCEMPSDSTGNSSKSSESTPLVFDPAGIPEDLKVLDQFVLYELRWSEDKGKYDKPPLSAWGGRNSFNNYRRWEEVEAHFNNGSGAHGIGVCFEGQYLIKGIDLDNCFLPNGGLKPTARAIVDRVPSWTEKSVSGKGLHILYVDPDAVEGDGFGDTPQVGEDMKVGHYSGSLYFAMTGQQWGSHGLVPVAGVGGFLSRYGKPSKPASGVAEGGVWEKIDAGQFCRAREDLEKLRGPDKWKTEDTSLIAWTCAQTLAEAGATAHQIACVLSDPEYAAASAKALGNRAGEIESAYRWAFKYQAAPAVSELRVPNTPSSAEMEGADAEAFDLRPVAKRWSTPPTPREWVWEQYIPVGKVASLYGDGGTGKSTLAQQLASAISLPKEKKFLGHEVKTGGVLGIFAEDDDNDLKLRQSDINRGLGVTLGEYGERLQLYGRDGEENLLCAFNGKDEITLTETWHRLYKTVEVLKPVLIILDTNADMFGGNDISTPQVRQFLKVGLGKLTKVCGSAVLLLAHPSAAGLSSGEGTHGSRQWTNGVRSRLYMEKVKSETGGETSVRKLKRMKANWSGADEGFLIWWSCGLYEVLPPEEVGVAEDKAKTAQLLEDFLEGLKAAIKRGAKLTANPRGNYAPKELAKDSYRGRRYTTAAMEHAMKTLFKENRLTTKRSRNMKTEYLELRRG